MNLGPRNWNAEILRLPQLYHHLKLLLGQFKTGLFIKACGLFTNYLIRENCLMLSIVNITVKVFAFEGKFHEYLLGLVLFSKLPSDPAHVD